MQCAPHQYWNSLRVGRTYQSSQFRTNDLLLIIRCVWVLQRCLAERGFSILQMHMAGGSVTFKPAIIRLGFLSPASEAEAAFEEEDPAPESRPRALTRSPTVSKTSSFASCSAFFSRLWILSPIVCTIILRKYMEIKSVQFWSHLKFLIAHNLL